MNGLESTLLPDETTLPLVAGTDPVERADAARNRRKILAAAAELFARRGAANVQMDEVAEAACVGKGTLYRRFGDRAGLALALLDERERRLQGALLAGPPPLGPGAPPAERAAAFLAALAGHVEENLDLFLLAEAGLAGARFHTGPYAFHRLHLALLVAEARPDLDADGVADALLAPLSAELVAHQRRDLGWPVDRVRAAAATMARGVLAS